MLKSVNGILVAISLSALALLAPTNVSADEISLTFEAHDFTLTGEIVGFVADNYVILTDNGEIHVPAAMVSCVGTACALAASATNAQG